MLPSPRAPALLNPSRAAPLLEAACDSVAARIPAGSCSRPCIPTLGALESIPRSTSVSKRRWRRSTRTLDNWNLIQIGCAHLPGGYGRKTTSGFFQHTLWPHPSEMVQHGITARPRQRRFQKPPFSGSSIEIQDICSAMVTRYQLFYRVEAAIPRGEKQDAAGNHWGG